MRRTLTNPGWLLLSAALSFGTVTACVSTAQHRRPQIDPHASAPAGTVTVHNQQLTEMRVYIVDGSAQYRLGLVPAMSSATFKIPRVVAGPKELRFLAASLTDDDTRSSEPLVMSATDAIEFTIGQTRVLSSLFLRR